MGLVFDEDEINVEPRAVEIQELDERTEPFVAIDEVVIHQAHWKRLIFEIGAGRIDARFVNKKGMGVEIVDTGTFIKIRYGRYEPEVSSKDTRWVRMNEYQQHKDNVMMAKQQQKKERMKAPESTHKGVKGF